MAKKKSGVKKAVGISTALLAAAAAGAYVFYSGPYAKKNHAKVKRWIRTAEKEVLSKAKKARSLSKGDYEDIVENVMARYKKLRSTTTAEVSHVSKELKKAWREMKKDLEKRSAPKRRSAQKTAKKTTTRKTSRKPSRKRP